MFMQLMKDAGSTKRLISITMDSTSLAASDKAKSKDHEKSGSMAKVGKPGKKAKAVVAVDG